MSEYTKGSWFNDGYEIKSNECCIEIAKVTVFNEGKANANLIAAAPELLEALEELVAQLEGDYFCFKNARSAIAKAKGESK